MKKLLLDSGFYFGNNTKTSQHFDGNPSIRLANFIYNSNLNNIKDLFVWIYNNKSREQVIDIHQWYGEKWYIVVKYPCTAKYRDKYPYPTNSQVGFTVDIKQDIILWVNDLQNTVAGGNCFTRNHKWLKLLKEKYNVQENKQFYWYKESTPQKLATKKMAANNLSFI